VDVSVAIHVPSSSEESSEEAAAGTSPWQVDTLRPSDTPIRASTVSVDRTEADTVVLTSTRLDLGYLIYGDGDLVATSFEIPEALPVAMSRQLAQALGASEGDELSATVSQTVLPIRVASIVPTVSSAPGRAGLLADVDTLSRALIGAGDLDPAVDAWWVAHPSLTSRRALQALSIGEITTRPGAATQLKQGPLRVTVPAVLVALVVAAVMLLLAGAGLAAGVERQRRSAEVVRLRAMGLTRREARRLLLAEHGAFLVPLVLAGVLVGAVAAVALGPDLVRSDLGLAPVPPAVVDWPWADVGALVGGLLLGCLVVAALVTASHLRRSDTTLLRTEES
jgi:hypothetical protein